MITLLIIGALLFEAVAEGLYLRGERGTKNCKWISKNVQILMFSCYLLMPYYFIKLQVPVEYYWKLPVLWVLIRTVCFNYIHNLAAFAPDWKKLGYLGKTSIVDRIVILISLGQWWMVILFQVLSLYFIQLILTNKI